MPPSLEDTWGKIQANQESERINYREMDPSIIPAWPIIDSEKSPKRQFDLKMDWLNQDSIESLRKSDHGHTIQPNSSRRMEPIRLSVPVGAAGAITQRGRCGKLGDF